MDKQDKQIVGISPLLYQDGITKEEHSVSLNDGTHWTQQVIRGNSGLTLVNNGYWNTEISALINSSYFWKGNLICTMDYSTHIYTVYVGNDTVVERIFIEEISGYNNNITLSVVPAK